MRAETDEKPRKLRYGYTTGACATACSLAAAQQLFNSDLIQTRVEITLPKGQQVYFELEYCHLNNDALAPFSDQISKQDKHNSISLGNHPNHSAIAATRKDAGDDPDVTHRAIIFVEVKLHTKPEILFRAGEGVGTITRKGLPIAVGEAAINPVPRKMIQQHLQQLAQKYHYKAGFRVIIGVENGVELAKKTLNARLGILGGLSILGTTGIVRPFSCSAYIASIHRAIDVAKANQITHIAACTGSGSEQMIQAHYQLSEMALIEMGDFVGAVLKYLKRVPIAKLSIVGGFGKISKLAAGHLDLHSRKSRIDFQFLADIATESLENTQQSGKIQAYILACNTSIQALKFCQTEQIDLATRICERALVTAQRYVPIGIQIEVFVIDRSNQLVGRASM